MLSYKEAKQTIQNEVLPYLQIQHLSSFPDEEIFIYFSRTKYVKILAYIRRVLGAVAALGLSSWWIFQGWMWILIRNLKASYASRMGSFFWKLRFCSGVLKFLFHCASKEQPDLAAHPGSWELLYNKQLDQSNLILLAVG